MQKRAWTMVGLFLAAGLVGRIAVAGSPGLSFPKTYLARPSQDYLRYLEDVRTGRWREVDSLGRPTAVPSPVDIAPIQALRSSAATVFPLTYDLRKLFKMTPVKNQSPLAGTTLFATLASLESFLRPDENPDFSESHLDATSAGEGFLEANLGALARWEDPLPEDDFPWFAPFPGQNPRGVKHVQNVLFIPPRADASDNDLIKQAVMETGAVYAEMYFPASAYNSPHRAFYNPSQAENLHAVAIAGWDDAFDRTKFNPAAPGNGAFICKNSLGPGWGEGGYFFVSYHDSFLARRYFSAAFTAEPAAGLTENYQHDPNGCTARLGFDQDVAWFANMFTAVRPDPLRAVGFYTYIPGAVYEILVYKDVTPGQPRSGTLAVRFSGTLAAPGYHTVVLPEAVPLAMNQRFSVAVKLRTAGDLSPIPLEHPLPLSRATYDARAGQSFISLDGAEWRDLVAHEAPAYAKSNVCLKAFAGYPPIYPPLGLKGERLVNNFAFFKEYVDRLLWLPNPKNADPANPVAGYRVYRKPRAAGAEDFEAVLETGPVNLVAYVRGLGKDDFFTYRVVAVLADGREGDPAEISLF
jgi:C1A family cysteine protease